MSQNIGKPVCPSCGSNDATLDPFSGIFTCNSCSVKYYSSARRLTQEIATPASVMAGTSEPNPLMKTEELEYRRTTMHLFPHSHEEFKTIGEDIEDVKRSVERLSTELNKLGGVLPKVVVLEEISREEAKQRVEAYFKEHGTADIEELMLNLRIPVETIVEIIDDLKKEGKLATKNEERT